MFIVIKSMVNQHCYCHQREAAAKTAINRNNNNENNNKVPGLPFSTEGVDMANHNTHVHSHTVYI